MTPTKVIVIGVLSTVLIIAGMMAGMPRYSVWQQEMSGKAEFAKAEQNRRIQTQEAQAMYESSKYKAKAEIERAKGVAEANKIIGDSLKGNEAYLRYLWVQGISDEQNVKTIYIPTENNLPLMRNVDGK